MKNKTQELWYNLQNQNTINMRKLAGIYYIPIKKVLLGRGINCNISTILLGPIIKSDITKTWKIKTKSNIHRVAKI